MSDNNNTPFLDLYDRLVIKFDEREKKLDQLLRTVENLATKMETIITNHEQLQQQQQQQQPDSVTVTTNNDRVIAPPARGVDVAAYIREVVGQWLGTTDNLEVDLAVSRLHYLAKHEFRLLQADTGTPGLSRIKWSSVSPSQKLIRYKAFEKAAASYNLPAAQCMEHWLAHRLIGPKWQHAHDSEVKTLKKLRLSGKDIKPSSSSITAGETSATPSSKDELSKSKVLHTTTADEEKEEETTPSPSSSPSSPSGYQQKRQRR
ncbi:uncharacterized protein BX664DRAFT_342940 [Halteromyces radiatus]|uniref:uncharacterized protein n=1 Tax=Halteromyces radiatus TaxID=101107 RepID=UPI00221EB5D5|nr:uncharacterized protein BX664DRAFT_342940 [Halteromyces radiatus]KAI8078878.1 hypothetical protein BX664DRAFT_342940 [Halteromyces radiatus]